MRSPFLCALGLVLVASTAHATGHDFVDDVLVAKGMPGELGIELASDSRIDRDFRLQGWFTSEVEAGIRGWVVEGVASLVNRGRGLEFAAWKAESRYVLAEQPRWPVALADAGEVFAISVAGEEIGAAVGYKTFLDVKGFVESEAAVFELVQKPLGEIDAVATPLAPMTNVRTRDPRAGEPRVVSR